ncbi:hypothetical protein [Amycolatopsis coloradensis]|uniref:hypothetical protein n=1 Tax=Amycolatopsis coloradensis TaxID=76021 RepID=UPI001ABF69C0|nr:hypothetical protein [Amycolatopsis coloradensis]
MGRIVAVKLRSAIACLAAAIVLLSGDVAAARPAEIVPPAGSAYWTWGCGNVPEFCYFKHYDANHDNGGWGRGFTSTGFYNIGAQGYGDQTSSIWNRFGKPVVLYDWNLHERCWIFLWYSTDGNWGNLPTNIDNRTDGISVGGEIPLEGICK